MGKSIFKNFDPEDSRTYSRSKAEFGWRHLGTLIATGICVCGGIKIFSVRDSNKFVNEHRGYSLGDMKWQKANNDLFLRIATLIESLAMTEIEKNPGINLKLLKKRPRANMMMVARNGGGTVTSGIKDSQLYAITGLLMIDDALTAISKGGNALTYGDSLIGGANLIYLGEKLFGNELLEPEVAKIEVKQKIKENSEKATKGYAGGQFGLANTKIFEEWEKQNKAITAKQNNTVETKRFNASEFARKMQEKHPLITDATTIKRWCTEWKKQKVSSLLAD